MHIYGPRTRIFQTAMSIYVCATVIGTPHNGENPHDDQEILVSLMVLINDMLVKSYSAHKSNISDYNRDGFHIYCLSSMGLEQRQGMLASYTNYVNQGHPTDIIMAALECLP
jgi:cytosine/uracil/thiamine/allantoin permease